MESSSIANDSGAAAAANADLVRSLRDAEGVTRVGIIPPGLSRNGAGAAAHAATLLRGARVRVVPMHALTPVDVLEAAELVVAGGDVDAVPEALLRCAQRLVLWVDSAQVDAPGGRAAIDASLARAARVVVGGAGAVALWCTTMRGVRALTSPTCAPVWMPPLEQPATTAALRKELETTPKRWDVFLAQDDSHVVPGVLLPPLTGMQAALREALLSHGLSVVRGDLATAPSEHVAACRLVVCVDAPRGAEVVRAWVAAGANLVLHAAADAATSPEDYPASNYVTVPAVAGFVIVPQPPSLERLCVRVREVSATLRGFDKPMGTSPLDPCLPLGSGARAEAWRTVAGWGLQSDCDETA